ncbi:MAG: hypothetical protein O3C62_11365 [Actinomycetota bacterium]|nr:hypothetical protein [Actinomycetota bacterium]MDA3002261.1 hypothetical protein [Actinomycetota bacterium]
MRTRTHEKKTKKTTSAPSMHWIDVIEYLDDRPRRVEALPHLRVGITVVEPGPSLDALWEKRRTKRPGQWGPLRYDLMHESSFDTRPSAETEKKAMIERLSRLGHAVNGVSTEYRTYVIELDDSDKPGHAGWLYVGQTSKPIAERIDEHRTGARFRSSSKVRKHFRSARLDLADPQAFFLQEDALMAEARLRIRLEQQGYLVDGGQERYEEALKES